MIGGKIATVRQQYLKVMQSANAQKGYGSELQKIRVVLDLHIQALGIRLDMRRGAYKTQG
ncbi:hypothetical protein [Granulosicoccus antarcticus]|uniref:Uncharacterized protein n=1 Tax=Granulosicoccus antarcticus IMCC3135 TaxID=1192854 RepID=A0A2Z2NKI8_9GAMM|nr:hypothetical protein [Granulosicoccus antarcticus]ASJ71653.1 hypothetical protein IMCC3135_07740 [Granulosicoccus antarcticus IMCC3135]